MDEEKQNSPRHTEARHAAKGLLKAAKLKTIPIAINQVMPEVKRTFDVTISGVPDKLFSGKGDALTEFRDPYVFIIYNKDRPVVRMRFSVAHELGHLYLGHLHGNSSMDIDSENFDEIEANTFASHLLMPPEQLRKDIKAGITNPEELAKRYGVSLEAMWFQLRSTNTYKLL